MLHYDAVGVLQAKLYSRSEELQIIRLKHEEECALTEKKEKSRKESARARAQHTVIISLEEELECKNQYIRSLEEYAATAAKFIKNTQDNIQHSTFQLDMMRLEKDQLTDHVSRLSQANAELHKKKAAAKKKMEKSKQEMDVEKRDWMDVVDWEVRRSGMALIQHDMERARCRQYDEGQTSLGASITTRDNRIMRLVVNGPPASKTKNMGAGFKPTGKVNLEMWASVSEEHNCTLIAMVEAMQLQKGQDEEEKKQLR